MPVVFSPEVLAAVHGGKAIKMGNHWKGATLDFSGFGSLVESLPEGTIRLIVNGILRAARVNRKVVVIFDPKEAWVWGTMLLRRSPSAVYKQNAAIQNHRRVELISTRRRRYNDPECPKGADVVFLRARRPNRASMKCLVSYLDSDGRKRFLSFVATSPAGPTAALEALFQLAHHQPGKVIAVPRRGAFATVLQERPANAHRGLAIHRIRSELSIEERSDHLLVHRSIRFRQGLKT